MTSSQSQSTEVTLIDAEKVDVGAPRLFDIQLSKSELADLAADIEVVSIRKFRLEGQVTRTNEDALELTAMLGATVTQSCVVTLGPVRTRLDAPVRRLFAKPQEPGVADYHITEEEDVEIDPLSGQIDLLQVAREELILAIPAYPRVPDAELAARAAAPPGALPDDPEQDKPFAALAALKAKMDDR